jgi:hypothetical protein
MKELKRSQSVPEALLSGEIGADVMPHKKSHQSALHSYGQEIAKTIRVLVEKVTDLRDELQVANGKMQDQRNEIQTLKHICEEQDGKCT